MEFRVFRKPDRTAESEDRPPVFGKRVTAQPPETRGATKQAVEAAALALGMATLVYLVVESL